MNAATTTPQQRMERMNAKRRKITGINSDIETDPLVERERATRSLESPATTSLMNRYLD
jgi:hypothetical protein